MDALSHPPEEYLFITHSLNWALSVYRTGVVSPLNVEAVQRGYLRVIRLSDLMTLGDDGVTWGPIPIV